MLPKVSIRDDYFTEPLFPPAKRGIFEKGINSELHYLHYSEYFFLPRWGGALAQQMLPHHQLSGKALIILEE